MKTIVMNTATAAVTEYDWIFQSITPTFAGSAAGLFSLGGDTDNTAPISGEIRSGRPGSDTMQSLGDVFVATQGDGVLLVDGRGGSWEYPGLARASGVIRFKPGRGIRERHLGLGFRNVAGAAFRLDSIDAEVFVSKSRRV